MSEKHNLDTPESTPPSKRSKRDIENENVNFGSSGTKDGYGHGIYEIQTFNPWNINRTYKHCIKNTRYLDWNFTNNQTGIIIPYHSIAFWMGHYDAEDKSNKTLHIGKTLNEISVGVDLLYGTIKFEVFAVTRNRLLQTGQTSGYTYELETSQNLIFATLDKDPFIYSFNGPKDLGFHSFSGIDLWPDVNDSISKIEIRQKEAYTHIVNFPKLNHNYHWTTPDMFDRTKSYLLCIPSNNNIKEIAGKSTMSHSSELMIDEPTVGTGNDAMKFSKAIIINPSHYPAILVGQPKINDETGVMKFRYNVRITTEFHLNFHIQPEYLNDTMSKILQKQTFHLPSLHLVKNGLINYPYIPYTL